jgi:hypothetical protein
MRLLIQLESAVSQSLKVARFQSCKVAEVARFQSCKASFKASEFPSCKVAKLKALELHRVQNAFGKTNTLVSHGHNHRDPLLKLRNFATLQP